MSLYEFKTIQRFDNKTIADPRAELSVSEKYTLWTEDKTTQRGKEVYCQCLDKDSIPLRDEVLVGTVAEQPYRDEFFNGDDGHTIVEIKQLETPEREPVGAKESVDRLFEVQ